MVDEVGSEADMVPAVVQVALEAAGEGLVVDMEAVVVEVLVAVDTVDLLLVYTMLVGHRYLLTPSPTSQLPVRREVKPFMFATFVSESSLPP